MLQFPLTHFGFLLYVGNSTPGNSISINQITNNKYQVQIYSGYKNFANLVVDEQFNFLESYIPTYPYMFANNNQAYRWHYSVLEYEQIYFGLKNQEQCYGEIWRIVGVQNSFDYPKRLEALVKDKRIPRITNWRQMLEVFQDYVYPFQNLFNNTVNSSAGSTRPYYILSTNTSQLILKGIASAGTPSTYTGSMEEMWIMRLVNTKHPQDPTGPFAFYIDESNYSTYFNGISEFR